jgi:hypothetical protein
MLSFFFFSEKVGQLLQGVDRVAGMRERGNDIEA